MAPSHGRALALAMPTPSLPVVANNLNVTGIFFTNNSTATETPTKNVYCTSTSYGSCYRQSQDPSVVLLSNGSVGVGFSYVTTHTTDACKGAAGNTGMRVGWVFSNDSGHTYSAQTQIGNTTCAYEQAIEPSFAAGPSGRVDGAFVESNASQATILGGGYPVVYYNQRWDDALGFVAGTGNGTAFGSVRTLVTGGNITRPQIATYGDSVYIVYENITNGTNTIPGGYYGSTLSPISVQLVYSSDLGATWHGPYFLPGMNATAFNTSMSPSIAVSSNGTVAVAYATNRSCLAWCYNYYGGYYYDREFGEDIVVATSATNGTTWKGPFTVQHGEGESSQYMGSPFSNLFQYAPETSIAWNAVGAAWDVAWAGAQNLSVWPANPVYDWAEFSVGAGASTNGGRTWATGPASAPLFNSASYAYGENYFNPALGVHDGTVTLTYTYWEETSTNYGCYITGLNQPWAGTMSQWVENGTDAVHWSGPVAVQIATSPSATYSFYPYGQDLGFEGSVGYTTAGAVVLGYALPIYAQYNGTSKETDHTVAAATALLGYSGPTTAVTFTENGVHPGDTWALAVDGNAFASATPNITVTNIPAHHTVIVAAPTNASNSPSFGEEYFAPSTSSYPRQSFTKPTILTFNFTLYVQLTLQVAPLSLVSGYAQITVYQAGSYDYYWDYSDYIYCTAAGCNSYVYAYGCHAPWWLPYGTPLTIRSNYVYGSSYAYYVSNVPVQYWAGVGTGNYTGNGEWANITLDAAIVETMWFLPWESVTEKFLAPTIPATSSFSLTFDGQSVSARGGGAALVKSVATGAYAATNVRATSSERGWEYFGAPSGGNPVIVPTETVVNLSFAYENLSAPPGPISFHAAGLTAGTVWQFSFNGTTLSSDTPWINVTAHPGEYPAAGFVVTSENDSVGYSPLNVPPVWSVSTGQTYTLNFTPVYKIDVVGTQGGTVTPAPATYWVAPGATKSLLATPATGFGFVEWTGAGPGSYTGTNLTANVTANGPIEEVAHFYPLHPDRFNLTFVESGVPNGTAWTVDVGGVRYASTNSTLTVTGLYSCTFSGSLGQYSVSIPYSYGNGSPSLTRYVPAVYPSSACGGTTQPISFRSEYYLTLEWTSGGNVTATAGSAVLIASDWVPAATGVVLQAQPSPNFGFLGWNGTGEGNYTGPALLASANMNGPITEIAAFAPLYKAPQPRFSVTFHLATPLPSGTVWGVDLGTSNFSSSTQNLTIPNLLAGSSFFPVTYPTATSPDGRSAFTLTGGPQKVTVSGNLTYTLGVLASFYVQISAIGPGTVGPASGWHKSGDSFELQALPSGANVFAGWAGTGASGSYSGPLENGTVHVSGPISEVATFVGPAPSAAQASGLFASTTFDLALGVVGLVAGVAIGLLLIRARRPPAEEAPPPESIDPLPPDVGAYEPAVPEAEAPEEGLG